MEQMFPCGLMSHEARRMWEREEGMRKKRGIREEEELRGRGRWRKPQGDICASEPTGRMNERLETRKKLKSIVQRLIMDLWRFLHDTKKTHQHGKCIWQLFNTSRQHSNIYSEFLWTSWSQFWTSCQDSKYHSQFNLIFFFFFFYLRQFSLSDFHISSYSVK